MGRVKELINREGNTFFSFLIRKNKVKEKVKEKGKREKGFALQCALNNKE